MSGFFLGVKKKGAARRKKSVGSIDVSGMTPEGIQEAEFLSAFRELKAELGDEVHVFKSKALKGMLKSHGLRVGAVIKSLNTLRSFYESFNGNKPQLIMGNSPLIQIHQNIIFFLPMSIKVTEYLQGVDVLRLVLAAAQNIFASEYEEYSLVVDCSLWNSDSMKSRYHDVGEALFQAITVVPLNLKNAFLVNLPPPMHKYLKTRPKAIQSRVMFCAPGSPDLLFHLGKRNYLKSLGGLLEPSVSLQQALVGACFFNEHLWARGMPAAHHQVGTMDMLRNSTDRRLDDAGVQRLPSIQDQRQYEARDAPVLHAINTAQPGDSAGVSGDLPLDPREKSLQCLYCTAVLGRNRCKCGRLAQQKALELVEEISYSSSEDE